jgi:hypothetical protein
MDLWRRRRRRRRRMDLGFLPGTTQFLSIYIIPDAKKCLEAG